MSKKLPFYVQTNASFFIMNLVFEKNANFFGRKFWQKSLKIVIIPSTGDFIYTSISIMQPAL
jgi:hypothetical protein